MDDNKIIELYWKRSEDAIVQTSKKYSRYCHYISFNILHNNEDAEECVNDTYLRAWNAMPPRRPDCLSTFLGRITRNLSIDKYRKYSAEKRGFGETALVLSELAECVPSPQSVEQTIDEIVLVEEINRFLALLSRTDRMLFMRRYWYSSSIKEIAEAYGMSESKVKSALFRTRNKLKLHLEKEGITI